MGKKKKKSQQRKSRNMTSEDSNTWTKVSKSGRHTGNHGAHGSRDSKTLDCESNDLLVDKKTPRYKYAGLRNGGSTCYMNSVLQQLYHTPGISQDISMVPSHGSYRRNIFSELQQVFRSLDDRRLPHMEGFWRSFKLWGERINTYEQQDAYEFFVDVISQLDDHLMETSQPDIFRPRFQGVYSDVKDCDNCNHRFESQEPFLAVSLTVKPEKSLTDALHQFVQGVRLQGDNAYLCDICGVKRNATKTMCIKTLPPVLVVHLKRIKMDWQTGRASKFNDFFKFPQLLDMEPYTLNNIQNQSRNGLKNETQNKGIKRGASTLGLDGNQLYHLVGVVVHMGQAYSGHYYSIIMDRHGKDRGKWYKFNDSSVSEYELTDTRLEDECFGGSYKSSWYDPRTYAGHVPAQKSHSGYMLFYEKVDIGETDTQTVTTVNHESQTAKRMNTNSSAPPALLHVETETGSSESTSTSANIDHPKESTTEEIKDKSKSSFPDKTKDPKPSHCQLRSSSSDMSTVSDSNTNPPAKTDKEEAKNSSNEWEDKTRVTDHPESKSKYASSKEGSSSHHQTRSKTLAMLQDTPTSSDSKVDPISKDHLRSKGEYADRQQKEKPSVADNTTSSSKDSSHDAEMKRKSSDRFRSTMSVDLKVESQLSDSKVDPRSTSRSKSNTTGTCKSKNTSIQLNIKRPPSDHNKRSVTSTRLEDKRYPGRARQVKGSQEQFLDGTPVDLPPAIQEALHTENVKMKKARKIRMIQHDFVFLQALRSQDIIPKFKGVYEYTKERVISSIKHAILLLPQNFPSARSSSGRDVLDEWLTYIQNLLKNSSDASKWAIKFLEDHANYQFILYYVIEHHNPNIRQLYAQIILGIIQCFIDHTASTHSAHVGKAFDQILSLLDKEVPTHSRTSAEYFDMLKQILLSSKESFTYVELMLRKGAFQSLMMMLIGPADLDEVTASGKMNWMPGEARHVAPIIHSMLAIMITRCDVSALRPHDMQYQQYPSKKKPSLHMPEDMRMILSGLQCFNYIKESILCACEYPDIRTDIIDMLMNCCYCNHDMSVAVLTMIFENINTCLKSDLEHLQHILLEILLLEDLIQGARLEMAIKNLNGLIYKFRFDDDKRFNSLIDFVSLLIDQCPEMKHVGKDWEQTARSIKSSKYVTDKELTRALAKLTISDRHADSVRKNAPSNLSGTTHSSGQHKVACNTAGSFYSGYN